MISDLKDEAQDFMSRQESIRTGPKGARASQSVENTHRKMTFDEEENKREVGKEFLSGLFKDEDEQIAMDKMPNSASKQIQKKQKKDSTGKKRKGMEVMAPKPPVPVK